MSIPFRTGSNTYSHAQLRNGAGLRLAHCLATDAEHLGNLTIRQPRQTQFHDLARPIWQLLDEGDDEGDITRHGHLLEKCVRVERLLA